MSQDSEILLKILDAVEDGHSLSQRGVAQKVGVALGLVNAYVKRCVTKGLLKVEQVPANRYAYYLTPTGFAEKSRLTIEYLSQSFNFFRAARSQCEDVFDQCAAQGWTRIVLCGASDLAQIACISAEESDITLVAVLDAAHNRDTFVGVPVVRNLDEVAVFDAVVVTDLRAPQDTHDVLKALLPNVPVLAPRMLRIKARRPGPAP